MINDIYHQRSHIKRREMIAWRTVVVFVALSSLGYIGQLYDLMAGVL